MDSSEALLIVDVGLTSAVTADIGLITVVKAINSVVAIREEVDGLISVAEISAVTEGPVAVAVKINSDDVPIVEAGC